MLSRVVTADTGELERLRWELDEAKAQQKSLLADNTRLRREFVRRALGEDTSSSFRALHEAALAIAEPVPLRRRALARFLANIVQRAVATLGALDGSLVLAPDPAWDALLGPNPRALAEEAAVESSGGHSSNRPASDVTVSNAIWLNPRGQLSSRALRPDGATAHVLNTGEAVLMPDTRASSPFGSYESLAGRGVLSFALVPLRRSEGTLGAVSVNFAVPGAVRDEERELLELFGAHAAAALDRIRLAHTERRLAAQEEELAQRDDEAMALRELDRLKSELLTTISHELRTPLTVIHGYAQRLATPGRFLPPERVQATAERILGASSQLARLVADLVDFSRMERGELAVQTQDVDLVPLLRNLVAGFQSQPGGERVCHELPASLWAHADPARVTQATSNLIENALKYAPEGTVMLRAVPPSMTGDPSDVVRVEVVDQGLGIAYDEQVRVWEKFFRGSGVAGLNVARGMGIGLAVVRALVEAQGGCVGLESEPGHGSRFWFALPAVVTE